MSPHSAAYARTVLRIALNDALRMELVVKNAAALARAPRVVAKDPFIVNVVEIERLIATAHGSALEAYVAVAAAVGLRPGEILGSNGPIWIWIRARCQHSRWPRSAGIKDASVFSKPRPPVTPGRTAGSCSRPFSARLWTPRTSDARSMRSSCRRRCRTCACTISGTRRPR